MFILRSHIFPWDIHSQPGLHFWSELDSVPHLGWRRCSTVSHVEAVLVYARKMCPKGVSTTTHNVDLQFYISLKALVFKQTSGWCKIMLNCNIPVLRSQLLNQKILLQDVIKNRLRYGVSHQWFAIIIWCGERNNKYSPCWTALAFGFVFTPRYFWFGISPFSYAALEPFLEQKEAVVVQPVLPPRAPSVSAYGCQVIKLEVGSWFTCVKWTVTHEKYQVLNTECEKLKRISWPWHHNWNY